MTSGRPAVLPAIFGPMAASAAPLLWVPSASRLAHFSIMISRSSAWCRAYSSQPSSACTSGMVSAKAATTSSVRPGSGVMVAMTTTDTGGAPSVGGEDRAQGGRDGGVGADAAQPPAAEAGELAGQVGVLLAGGVQQHVQPRQPRGPRAAGGGPRWA